MPTRNISLTAEQDAFVQEVVEAGEYQNASEAIRDALRALQQRRKEDGLKRKVLRAQIKAGTDALERGDFADVDDADLEGYLERLTAPNRARQGASNSVLSSRHNQDSSSCDHSAFDGGFGSPFYQPLFPLR
jgi:antitoxin ParD1/3/4